MWNLQQEKQNLYDFFGKNGNDANGHGTHVAGIIDGKNVGIANECILYSIKILDQDGSGSDWRIIKGIECVMKTVLILGRKSIISMSSGGYYFQSLNDAIYDAFSIIDIVTIVAAGNDNDYACNYSPAAAFEAITVGSTTNNYDQRSSFSNYGSCVDIYAPGENIYSSYFANASSYKILSGTSMATPLVSGVVAIMRQLFLYKDAYGIVNMLKTFVIRGLVCNLSLNDNGENLFIYLHNMNAIMC